MPIYEYFCDGCGSLHDAIYGASSRPNTMTCPECGESAEYRVGKPAMFRIKFDNQGRIGYKNDLGNGKQTYRSATREQYEHTIGNRSMKDLKALGSDKAKSVYTKEYQRAVDKAEKNKIERRKATFKKILKEAK